MAEPVLVFSFVTEKIGFGPGDIMGAAAVVGGPGNELVVTFRMSLAKAAEFGEMTSRHVGDPMDILVCGKLMSSPVIMEPIRAGSGQISGGLQMEEAQIIAEKIRTGACAGV